MAELIIAKHRNGALANIKLRFITSFAKFADMESDIFEPEVMENGEVNNSFTMPSKINDMNDEDIPY